MKSRMKCPKCKRHMNYVEFPDRNSVEISCDYCEFFYLYAPILSYSKKHREITMIDSVRYELDGDIDVNAEKGIVDEMLDDYRLFRIKMEDD